MSLDQSKASQVSPSVSQQSVDGASECTQQLSSSFCFRLRSLQLIYCRLPPSLRRHRRRRRLRRPSAGWISQETSPLPQTAAVSQSPLLRWKNRVQISRQRLKFIPIQETGRSSRCAHWPRNGGGGRRGLERRRRRRPNERTRAAEEGDGGRETKGEATRNNI